MQPYERVRYRCEIIPLTLASPVRPGERVRTPWFRIQSVATPTVTFQAATAEGAAEDPMSRAPLAVHGA